MKTLTIEQAQELRTKGNWLVTNRNMTKVIFCGSEIESRKKYNEKKLSKAGAKIFGSLVKYTITKEEIKYALSQPSLYSM